MYGPTNAVSRQLHAEKYRQANETFEQAMWRIAGALKDDGSHFDSLLDILLNMRFLPAGRVQAAVGAEKEVTALSCFVMSSIPDSMAGIMRVAAEAAETMRRGGGVGYNFETLRPKGSPISTQPGAYSSGPVSFMEIFDTVCRKIASAGNRRGAQMGVLPCLAGETKIHTLSNGRVPIKKLVGTQPYLYVVRNGRLAVEKAQAIFKSGTKQVVTVVLDNDTEITCTPDHKFMLSNGAFVEAKDLRFGDSLMAIKKSLTKRGYYQAECTGNRMHQEHRLVYESVFGSIPKGYHIHHKDENKLNNDPDNLECLTQAEHAKLHSWTFEEHRERISSERKGKTLEEWLGAERAEEVRANMSAAKRKQYQEMGVWNESMNTEEYKKHYPNGFSNQYSVPNHQIVRVEDRGEVCDVYDITMPYTHNFFAEEVCVHNCWHPDIEEFIEAKQNNNNLTAFNVSVWVDDAFMEAVVNDEEYPLHFNGEVVRTVRAAELWEKIMRATWDWAEPGILFGDTINRENNLKYCETIRATNPCGELPLPPYGACLLGSFNLVKYIEGNSFNYRVFSEDIVNVVRAMDNVIDVTIYPLPEQEMEARNKRRIGLGYTGLANALEMMGFSYASPEFIKEHARIASTLRDVAYQSSALLAVEKGPFPLYDARYMQSPFINNLPEATQRLIARFGIRNSHLLSVAPTGTISLTADNVSSGIEPPFAYAMERDIIGERGKETVQVLDYAADRGVFGKQSKEVTIEEHLAVLLTAQTYCDSSVSKTCNVSPDMPWEEFKDLYYRAWKGGAKGLTTFNPGGKRFGVIRELEPLACFIDDKGQKHCE